MKRKSDILSNFISILICLIIIAIVVFSLDIIGVINLPEKFSVKRFFPNTVLTVGSNDGEVDIPAYNATGTTAENNDDEVIENKVSGSTSNALSKFLEPSDRETGNSPEYNVTDNSFFYNQLDTYGKTIYSKVYASLDILKTGTGIIDFGTTFNELLQKEDGNQKLTDSFQLAINALLLDHPEIFYIDVTKMYMFTETTTNFRGTTYKISIGPSNGESYLSDGFYSKSNVETAETQVENVLDNITYSLYGSDYDKIKKVHNYLVDHVSYDQSNNAISHGLYGALVYNSAVCDGYAKAFKYILDKIGISCVEVCGTAENSSGNTENHAWNDVLLDGNWYAIDVTWDDPILIGGNGKLTNELRYANFLKGISSFYNTHVEDGYVVSNGEFKYPNISYYDYEN